MSTMTTRIGGWPVSFIIDSDSAMLAHIAAPNLPTELSTVRAQPEGQTFTLLSAFVSDVIQWQDAAMLDGLDHFNRHLWAAMEEFRLSIPTPHSAAEAKNFVLDLFRSCPTCLYWRNVTEQRVGARITKPKPPLPVVTEPRDGWKVALFYKSRRLRDMGDPYWVTGDDGVSFQKAHVEVFAPWGEVLCAEAPLSEIILYPYHSI